MHHIVYFCKMENVCKICPFSSKTATPLNECDFEQLSANHIVVKFTKGDAIIKQGTYSTNIAFLRVGLAKIHLAGPSHEQIVRLVKAPAYLGLPTTFGDKINQYSATAVTDAELCFIDVMTFRDLLKNNDLFSYEIILDLCRNELDSFRRCSNRTQKQSRGNLADMLLELSDRIFESDIFVLPLSQSEMGNLVDTSRESISRMLSEFNRDGIIRVNGKQVEILNKKSLQLISQNG